MPGSRILVISLPCLCCLCFLCPKQWLWPPPHTLLTHSHRCDAIPILGAEQWGTRESKQNFLPLSCLCQESCHKSNKSKHGRRGFNTGFLIYYMILAKLLVFFEALLPHYRWKLGTQVAFRDHVHNVLRSASWIYTKKAAFIIIFQKDEYKEFVMSCREKR